MNHFHLGIDVAKAKLDCVLRRPDGKHLHKVVANTAQGFNALLTWLAKHKACTALVCMEATGIYWEAVAEHLAAQGMKVSVVNPAQIKSFGASRMVRTKTDKVDAVLIAEFCKEREPAPWQPPAPSETALRALVLRLEALQSMRTQEGNRLEVARDAVRDDIAKHVAWLDTEIKALIKKIRIHVDDHPDLKDKRDLLDSIPGLGERIIPILLSYYGTPDRFGNARQASAFAGLDPRHHESGSSVNGKPRLSKVGHTFLRKSLYMPAMVTLYRTAWGKVFRERLASSGKPPMLIIGAMMRKLVQVAFGVLRSGKPFNMTLHHA